jgi:copper/silver efflux system protein
VLVPASEGQRQIPLSELARVKVATGPAMIRDEDGLLTGYVFVDVGGRDISSYVDEASRVVREQVKLPPGYAVLSSGQYEAMARVRARLTYIIPFTMFLVFVLLSLNTRSFAKTAIVLLAVPFSAVGAVWYLYLLGYNMSIAVWVGLIALLGVDAETGIFMLLYLDLAYEKASREGRLRTLADLQEIVEGAAKRLRPKFMPVDDVRRVDPDHVGHRHRVGRVEAKSPRRWLAASLPRSSSSSSSTRRSTKFGSGTSR